MIQIWIIFFKISLDGYLHWQRVGRQENLQKPAIAS